MKAVAWLLGLAVLGGLVVMAIAGVTAVTAVLVTAAAVVVMIALGNTLGGRTTPNRAPLDASADDVAEDRSSGEGGTSEGTAP